MSKDGDLPHGSEKGVLHGWQVLVAEMKEVVAWGYPVDCSISVSLIPRVVVLRCCGGRDCKVEVTIKYSD